MSADATRKGSWKGRIEARSGSRTERLRQARRRALALESLESRQLLSNLPAPTRAATPTSLFTPPGSGGVSNTTIAVNPAHPNIMVALYQRNDASSSPYSNAFGVDGVFIQASVSRDGGKTWTNNGTINSNIGNGSLDFTVTTNTPPFAAVTNASVAFDSHDHFWVLTEARKADYTAGQLMLNRFTINPTTGAVTAGTLNTMYTWNTAASPATYPAFQPTLAVDGNQASFGTQSDPNTSFNVGGNLYGAVYVAFVLPPASGAASLFLAASADGGTTFAAQQVIAAGGTSSGSPLYASPSIAISQGTGGATGGRINIVWDDYGSGGGTRDFIRQATYSFNGANLTTVTANHAIAASFVKAGTNATGNPVTAPNSGSTLVSPLGISPAPVIASDNTLGTGSPRAGRLYVAYVDNVDANGNAGTPTDNTDVFVITSDDYGANWSNPVRVNDDSGAADGFSEGSAQGNAGRPQFMPSIAVDPVTGGVAVSYYDARNDPSRARVATYVNVSNDGGATFSPGTYANNTLTTTDAITGQTVNLGPVPDNDSAGNSLNRDTTYGYGDHQGLAFYNGVVVPVWASNQNGGGTAPGGAANVSGWTAAVGRLTTAAGPRVVSSTMGPVGLAGDTVNTTTAADGSVIANSFLVNFDRPVDVNSLNAGPTGNVTINYLSPDGTVSNTYSATSVTAVGAVGGLATQFRVTFTPTSNPKFGYVGTYRYSIAPNAAAAGTNTPRTLISYVNTAGNIVTGSYMDQNANGSSADGTAGDTFSVTASPGSNVLPLIVGGPRLASVSLTGSSAVNGVVTVRNPASALTSLTLTFDRNMDPTTIVTSGTNPASNVILRFVGPAGIIPVTSSFSIAQGANAKTYVVTFPATALSGTTTNAQTLSGTYSLSLASGLKDTFGNTLDTNANAGVYQLQGSDPTGPTVSNNYATSPSAAIPQAPTSITSSINVPTSYVLKGISVGVNITYPLPNALTVSLVGPDGKTVVLFQNVGGTTGTGFNVTLDDTITPGNPITNSGAAAGQPITGSYNPQYSLGNAFVNGTYLSAGTWTLVVASKDTTGLAGTLNSWSLVLKSSTLGTGLGESIADQATAGFRVENMSPTVLDATQQWVSVGPSPIVTSNPNRAGTAIKSGLVGALAVDPSDPSGNTVYAGGATGGVWKTTNFLTADSGGPTWIPLTDFGPNAQINVGTITVVPQKNAAGVFDPLKSIVMVGLGDGDTAGANSPLAPARGLGFLISTDGGATFQAVQGVGPGDTTFASNTTYVNKIAVDPTPNPVNGKLIVYAALSGSGASSGLWRSTDGGTNWSRVLNNGAVTDVTLDQLSGQGVGGGNLQTIYAAVPGVGVFSSPNQGQSWFQVLGNIGNPLIQDTTNGQLPVVPNTANPVGASGGRVYLAKPAVTSSIASPSLQDQLYEGWLYALAAGANGTLDGLYLTKDYGQNWTKIVLPQAVSTFGVFSSNDPSKANAFDPSRNTINGTQYDSTYNLSFAVNPTNPNVVYIGGAGGTTSPGFYRVDVSVLADAHSFFPHSVTNNDGGALTYNAAGGVTVSNTQITSRLMNPLTGQPYNASFLNLIRDPQNVFSVNSTIKTVNINQFNNTGAGAKVLTYLSEDNQISAAEPAIDYASSFHRLVAYTDPVTQLPRIIFGTNQGVFTGVDNAGVFEGGVGTAAGQTGPIGNRNGNLALTQFFYGAVQPSSKTPTGTVFYGGTRTQGSLNSGAFLTSGSTQWSSSAGTTPTSFDGNSYGVATDQTGSGTVYRFVPFAQASTDFFQVQIGGTGSFISRTFGLTTGPSDGQWSVGNVASFNNGLTPFGNFAVNPVSGQQILIVSNNGTIYRTENLGVTWANIGSTGDGQYAPAVAFGAPKTVGNLDNYMMVGTLGGRVYVTTTGGGGAGNAWANVSTGLDGSTVQRLVANPARNSVDAYAITLRGVYYNANVAGGGSWANITGNLTTANFPKLTGFTAMVADWRYLIPDNPSNPSGPTHPALYVSGDVGVYRSLDKGTTWTLFPSNIAQLDSTNLQQNVLAQSGGYLPDTRVMDLTLVSGNVNPANGRATWQTGDPTMLVASTWGRGQFAIQLAPTVVPNANATQPGYLTLDTASVIGLTNSGTQIVDLTKTSVITLRGYSSQSNYGNLVNVALYNMTGVAAGNTPPSLTVSTSTQTDPNTGAFTLSFTASQLGTIPFTGKVITVGVQATDQTGAKGNLAVYTFIVQNPKTAAPSQLVLDGTTDSGTYNDDQYTNFNNSTTGNAPVFDVSGVILPPAGQATTVVLLRASQVNGVVGTFQEVSRQSYLVSDFLGSAGGLGVVQIADTNGGNGTIPDTPVNASIDAAPNQPNQYVYQVYQIDYLNGQSASYTAPLGVIIDTTAPATPKAVTLSPSTDSGPSGTDNYTNFNNGNGNAPLFDVTGIEPHATVVLLRTDSAGRTVVVNILKDVAPAGATNLVQIADINGNNTTIADSPVGTPEDTPPPAGNPYTYSAIQIDLASNPSGQSDTSFGNRGSVVIDGTDADNHGTFNTATGQNETGWLYMQKVIQAISPNITSKNKVLVALGANPAISVPNVNAASAVHSIASAFALSGLPAKGWTIEYVTGAANIDAYLSGQPAAAVDINNAPLGTITIAQTGFMYITTVGRQHVRDDMTDAELGIINTHGLDILSYVNTGAGLYTQSESFQAFFGGGGGQKSKPYGWLSALFPGIQVVSVGNAFPINIQLTPAGKAIFPGLTSADLSGGPWHDYFAGTIPSSLASMFTDTNPADRNNPNNTVILGLSSVGSVSGPPTSGSQVIIDSTPPIAPGLGLNASSDSGTYNNDKVTNRNNNPSPANAPVFDLTGLEANVFVELYRAKVDPVTGLPGTPVLVNSFTQGIAGGSNTIADLNAGNGTIPDATYVYTVRQTDLAGNVGTLSTSLTVVIDSAAPVAPSSLTLDPSTDTGTFNNDNVTQDNNGTYPAPLFNVKVIEAHATVRLYRATVINGVPGLPTLVNTLVDVTPGAGGLVQILDTNANAGQIPDGTYLYTAQQLDVAGNASGISSPGLTVVIDTRTPAPVPLPAPDLQAASDTGTFNNDNVTQANNGLPYATPLFDIGTAANPVDKAATVQLFRALVNPVTGLPGAFTLVNTLTNVAGGVVVIGDTNAGNGVIPDGTYLYRARLTSLTGVAGAFSTTLQVVINANPPGIPSPFRLSASSDTGVSNADGITQITLSQYPVFDAGGVVAGATLNLFRNGTLAATRLNSPGGTVQIVDANSIPDGTYTYTVQQVDLMGNASAIGNPITVVYDTTQPPTPSRPTLDPSSDTGPLGDNTTSNTSPLIDVTVTVSGTKTNSQLTLIRDGNVVATTTYNVTSGVVQLKDVGPVPFGTHIYQAYLTDLAGNLSPISGPLSILFANDPPGTLTLDPASDSGTKGDRLTNATTPTFDVLNTTANVTLRLLRNGLPVAEVPTKTGGTVLVTDPGPLVDGRYTYTAVQVDSLGNVSPPGPALVLTVDTTVPVPPTGFKLSAASDTGVPGDGITSVTNPSFDATGIVAGATVLLFRSGVQVATASSLLGGSIVITDPGPVPGGRYTYTIQQVTIAGNASATGAPLSITIDTTTPAVPALALDPGSDSGTKGDNVTNVLAPFFDATQVVTGSTLKLFRNGLLVKTLANVTPNAQGIVLIQDPGPLTDGAYTYTAQQVAPSGNSSAVGGTLVLTVNTAPPAKPTTPSLALNVATSDSGIKGDYITAIRRPTFTGSADPSVAISLFSGTTLIGTATTNALGNFSVTVLFDLPIGRATVTAVATDFKNAKSDPSAPVSLLIASVSGDYNGDTKTEPALFNRTNASLGQWFVQGIAALNGLGFGSGGLDVPLAGDFNGDGKTDLALYRPSTGVWYVAPSSTYAGRVLANFGGPTDVPMPGNWEGSGVDLPGLFRPSTGQWFVFGSNGAGRLLPVSFAAGDVAAPADYDAINRTESAVYRPSTSQWFVAGPNDTSPRLIATFGGANDVPVPGAYLAPATVTPGVPPAALPAVYRPSTGQYFIYRGNANGSNRVVTFAPGDIPAPGDYDGIGITEPAVFRPSTQQWLVMGPTDNAPRVVPGPGLTTGIPTLSPYPYRALKPLSTGGGGGVSAASVGGGSLNFGANALGLSAAGGGTVAPPASTAAAATTTHAPAPRAAAHRNRPAQHHATRPAAPAHLIDEALSSIGTLRKGRKAHVTHA